ncbi:ABC transporter permease [Bradyrhizobium sp. Gha]|uniref:ABC transporter permease n=1 Tax=Bradyrhizobium sp. Gha TaxID=1855318 RepID=UPI0008F24406|nr:ABC transporter permease [Bradyrhizobium sp. Gha]SFJ70256.1 monosaccharide ABC transporter membrane protein, CUT2 family [Bradyrhizobium sp. Gha]
MTNPRLLRAALPFLTLAFVLTATFYVQPRTMSYFGLNLMLQYAVPIALATIAQMFIITVNDLDLSIGPFVGLVGVIAATVLNSNPVLGASALMACVLAYGVVGALIHVRNLPSIVVTLGLSFVWLGIAVMMLPSPGGKAPAVLKAIMTVQTPYVPFPILAAVAIGLVVHLALMTTSFGVVARGAGGNPKALDRAGWSMLGTKVVMYMLAGLFGLLAGLALLGLTTSADAHVADRYTLYSIAGVILGGGEFIGGRINPIGAVAGALTLALAGAFLIFLRISPDWQIGAQGAVLIIVLALRALAGSREKSS